ncbi:MAG: DUF366 family protein [Candidatus Edwardsbacteria bacterium]
MQIKFIKKRIALNEADITPGLLSRYFGIEGNALVSLKGSIKWKGIFLKEVLHFLMECPKSDLEKILLHQRFLVQIVREKINHRLKGDIIQRWGVNLFDSDRRVSLSIVRQMGNAGLIYLGLPLKSQEISSIPNLSVAQGSEAFGQEGLLPKAGAGWGLTEKWQGLQDYQLDPQELAEAIMVQYQLEMKEMGKENV